MLISSHCLLHNFFIFFIFFFEIKSLVSRGANLSHVVILLSAALEDIQKSFQSGALRSRKSWTIDEEDLTVSIQQAPLTAVSGIQIKDLSSMFFLSLY